MGVRFPRCSGLLLHITSLPSPYGIGDLGNKAYAFADFLRNGGHKLWQVLPLNPTGYGDSPYQCFSAFAGNPLLLDLLGLEKHSLLTSADIGPLPAFPPEQVDYGTVIPWKLKVLKQAAENFRHGSAGAEFEVSFRSFCRENSSWLEDYALFMACKDANQSRAWTEWESGLRDRDTQDLERFRGQHRKEIEAHKLWQYEFFYQWSNLKAFCNQYGIRIMGDIPIYVAHDSADVWAHRELFYLNADGRPTVVSGVPPDYFSATGQLWGNPIYRWNRHAATNYAWWIERFRAAFRIFDVVRLDHFRGFEAYWEVPGGEPTAVNGRWVKGPGADLFHALRSALGNLPIVAENLGVITPQVEAIRKDFDFPGMSLLQFAFGTDPQGPSFRPHNYVPNLVAYTGGHDNDTTVGWWNSSAASDSTRTIKDVEREHEFARAYLNFADEPVNWVLIRAVLASVADTVIIPLQDVLGLGSNARMNLPGRISGNWRWRFRGDALTVELQERLRELNLLYDR
jgi:4-alpha-glucanotransferase